MAKKAPNNKSRKAASSSSPATTGKTRLRVKSKNKKVAKVDTKMPKKPPTAFFYFLDDFRKEFQEENQKFKSKDVSKACGEKWRTMKYEEKVQYYDIATVKRAEFDRAIAAYNNKKESGEDEESDDSEFED